MSNSHRYGTCPDCDVALEPIWFTDEETVVANGVMVKTGRTRLAVDYLICPFCLKRFCCDDSFDAMWR